MKYKTITIQKAINLGNYESQRLEITVEVDTESEDELNDALLELNATISDALEGFRQDHLDLCVEREDKKKASTTFPGRKVSDSNR